MGLSFVRGLVASVNPCAFVLLPTYLMYFLGMEGHRPGSQRASVRRALIVAASVSAGFLAVFTVVGVISQFFTRWIEANAIYVTGMIGLAFVVLGIAMLRGFKLTASTPQISVGQRDRTVQAMFLYGVVYAVTSLGCTLPLFSITLFSTVSTKGWIAGVLNVVAYGLGMALMVSALTVTLAFARTGLLQVLRNGSRNIDRLAAVLVIVSGIYLMYYFWVYALNRKSSPVIRTVERFQADVQRLVVGHWQVLALVLIAIVGGSAVYAFSRRRPSGAPSDTLKHESH